MGAAARVLHIHTQLYRWDIPPLWDETRDSLMPLQQALMMSISMKTLTLKCEE